MSSVIQSLDFSVMYFLKCSVCNGEFKTKESWTWHLIEQSHLNKARKKCVRWSPKRKRHVIVAYATFPMSSPLGLSLLQILSKDLLTFVTDFVWREGNSRVGLIQFESSDGVSKILASLGNPQSPRIEVDGYPVTFRRAIDLVDLEWETLVTPELEAETFSGLSTSMVHKEQTGEDGKKKEKGKKRPSEQEKTEVEFAVSSTTTSVIPPLEIQLSSSEGEEKSLNNSCEDLSEENSKKLGERFSSLLETVRIPDSEYNVILGIVKDVQGALLDTNGQDATIRICLFRNWYLQLRNATHNPLLLFVYHEVDSSISPIHISFEHNDNLLHALEKTGLFILIRSKSTFSRNNEDVSTGDRFIYTKTGTRLRIVTLPLMLTEVQRCRLFQYYVTFDPRIKDLIALIYLWSRINNIRIAYSSNEISKFDAHCCVPDPGALEWLLVVFLCKENIIPTPREIQQRPHNQVCLKSGKFDMGFCEDAEFAKEWSRQDQFNIPENTDEFALSVLELAGKYFLFCANLGQQPCIVNTRDGEVFPRDFIHTTMSQSYSNFGQTKLSPWELQALYRELNFNATCQNNISKQINIQHPFNITWRFSIDDKNFLSVVCPKMKTTGNRLLHFAKRVKVLHMNNQVLSKEISTNVDLENLFKC